MRHGSGSDAIKADPNLVPLLDLVFQLIMFFMICVNFVSEQVNQDIKLPVAQSARPMDKGEIDVLFLNMDKYGNVMVPGRQQPLVTTGDKQHYLNQEHADKLHFQQIQGDKSGSVKTAVIIRADQGAKYGQIFELLHLCKQAGYHKLQLRAYTPFAGG
jgi:biopolymer transport protein ExbD